MKRFITKIGLIDFKKPVKVDITETEVDDELKIDYMGQNPLYQYRNDKRGYWSHLETPYHMIKSLDIVNFANIIEIMKACANKKGRVKDPPLKLK